MRFSIATRHDALMASDPDYRAAYDRFHRPDGSALPNWLKAPNGQPSKLDPVQYVQVRTPAFKTWFGDWEKKAKLAAVDALAPIAVTQRQEGISPEEAYKALGEGENETDGRRVKFVNSTLGKIIRHKGFDTSRIVHQLKEIYAKSVPVATNAEKEIVRQDGTAHKRHPNLVGYHTYVGKIADGAETYYVRFTVQEEKTRQKDYNPNAVHSTFVSDVAIYNSGKALSQSTTTVGESELSRTDGILAKIFAEFNRASAECSKVVDENGEPLVVYHGTWNNEGFTVFRTDHGSYFSSSEKNASGYAMGRGSVYATFLNIRNPESVDADGSKWSGMKFDGDGKYKDALGTSVLSPADIAAYAKDSGKDGAIVRNVLDGDEKGDDYIVFSPAQVKSATDNAGAFSPANPDIRFSITHDEFEKIEKYFGTTSNPLEAGWILPNGHMLDLSLKRELGDSFSNERYAEHYDIRDAIDERGYADPFVYRDEMLYSGAVRIDGKRKIIDIKAHVSDEQIDSIYDFIDKLRGEEDGRSFLVAMPGIGAFGSKTFSAKTSAKAIVDLIKANNPKKDNVEGIMLEAFSRKVEEEIALAPHALNAPTPRSIPQSAAAAQGRNVFSIGTDADEVAALLMARNMMETGLTPTAKGAEAVRRSLRANASAQELVGRAAKIAEEQRKVLNYVASDPVLDRIIARAAKAARHARVVERTRKADIAWAHGVEKREKAIRRAEERELRGIGGVDGEAMLNFYGIDPAALLMSFAPPPRAEAQRKDGGEAASAADVPHALTPEAWTAAKARADELIARVKELAAKAREEAKENPVAEKRRTEKKGAAAGEEAGERGDAADEALGSMMTQAVRKAIAESGITLDDAAGMVKFAEAFTEQYLKDNPSHFEGLDFDNLWDDPRVRAFLSGNIASLAQMAAEAYAPSYARERVAAKAQMLDDRAVTTLGAIERIGVEMFEDLNRDLVRQSRRELIREIHRTIDRLAKGHRDNQLAHERKVEGEVSEWLKFVRRAIDMSAGEVERRSRELMDFLNRSYASADDAEDSRFRDYHLANLELAVLDCYGNLRGRMPAEIMAARDHIEQTVNESKWAAMQAQEAFEKTADALITDMAGGISPNPKDGGLRPEETPRVYSLVGMMEAVARLMTRFTRDGATRDRSLKAFAAVEEMVQQANDAEVNFINRYKDELLKLLVSAYGSGRAANEAMAEAVDAPWFHRDGQDAVQVTVGRMLQMYAAIIQTDYSSNREKWGRDAAYQALLEDALGLNDPDSPHRRFLEGLRAIYGRTGRELDEVIYRTTGTHMRTPNRNYLPVVMAREKNQAKDMEVRAFSPFAPALTPRVRNGLDFDESADIIDVFMDRLAQSAHTVAWAERGPMVMRVAQSDRVLGAIKKCFGVQQRNRWNNHILDIVAGPARSGAAESRVLRGLMRYGSRLWLGLNPANWAKQLASVPCLGLSTQCGSADWVRSAGMWFLHPFQMAETARDLAQTEAFKARYGAAISQELRYATSGETAFKNWLGRLGDAIMSGVYAADKLGVLVCAGVYARKREEFERMNKPPKEASELAANFLMHIADKTMQTGRTANMTELQRKGGMDALIQFQSAPMQQLQFEIVALAEVKADPNNAAKWKRLVSVLLVNHVAVPMMLTVVDAAMAFLTSWGIPDEDKRERVLRHLVEEMVMGPFGSLFFIGGVIEYGFDKIIDLCEGKKSGYGKFSLIPAEGVVEHVADNVGKLIEAAMDITNADIVDTAIEMAKAIGTITPGLSWITRTATKAYESATENPRRKSRKANVRRRYR